MRAMKFRLAVAEMLRVLNVADLRVEESECEIEIEIEIEIVIRDMITREKAIRESEVATV